MKAQVILREIILTDKKETRFFDLEKLQVITVEDYLCTFFMDEEEGAQVTFSCTGSLKEVEAMLPKSFIRINRNCIVDTHKMRSINHEEMTVLMRGGKTYALSVRSGKKLNKKYREKDTLTLKK